MAVGLWGVSTPNIVVLEIEPGSPGVVFDDQESAVFVVQNSLTMILKERI